MKRRPKVMKRATAKPKRPVSKTPQTVKDQAWFEQKVSELKAELEKLPADRREQFMRELEKEIEE